MLAPVSQSSLSVELRWLRASAGLTGPVLASDLGTSQSALSRWENEQRRPPAEKVISWFRVCLEATRARLDDDTLTVREHRLLEQAFARMSADDYLEGLLWLAADATEVVSNFVITQRGLAQRQQELMDLDRRVRRLRVFQPLMCPGPFQTLEYARAVMLGYDAVTEAEALAAAERRFARGEAMKLPGAAAYHAVITEQALDLRLARATGDLRQGLLSRLVEFAQLAHITVQVIERAAPYGHVPVNSFAFYELVDGEPFALTETYNAQVSFTAPRDVERYEEVWGQLAGMALDPATTRVWLENELRIS